MELLYAKLEDGSESPTQSFNGFEIDGKQLEVFKNPVDLVAPSQGHGQRRVKFTTLNSRK